jgi:hypothetical protein
MAKGCGDAEVKIDTSREALAFLRGYPEESGLFTRELAIALIDVIDALRAQDQKAGKYVESVICMRTGFTGDEPYVGWKGLGLALTEALDERDALRAERKESAMQSLADDAGREFLLDDRNALRAALKALVDRIDFIDTHPEFKSVWTIYYVHGGVYGGPNWAEPLEAARKLLKAGP